MVEAVLDIDHELVKTNMGCQCSMQYRSVVGVGKISFITKKEDKIEALNILMNHYREGWGHRHQYKGCLTEIFIIRIDIDTDTVTGKKSENRHMDVDVERFEKRERRLKSS